jgi:hypothetical protein
MIDLPVAEKPMMAIFLFAFRDGMALSGIGRTEVVPVVCQGFLQMVAAEFV